MVLSFLSPNNNIQSSTRNTHLYIANYLLGSNAAVLCSLLAFFDGLTQLLTHYGLFDEYDGKYQYYSNAKFKETKKTNCQQQTAHSPSVTLLHTI